MTLLHGGVDLSVIALWLESTDATQIYLHADMSIKERALGRTTPAWRSDALATSHPIPCSLSSMSSDVPEPS